METLVITLILGLIYIVVGPDKFVPTVAVLVVIGFIVLAIFGGRGGGSSDGRGGINDPHFPNRDWNSPR